MSEKGWESIAGWIDDPYYQSLEGCQCRYDADKQVLHIRYRDEDEKPEAAFESYDVTLRESGDKKPMTDFVAAAYHVACIIKTLRCCDEGQHSAFDTARVRPNGIASFDDGSAVGLRTPMPICRRPNEQGTLTDLLPRPEHFDAIGSPPAYLLDGKPSASAEVRYHMSMLSPNSLLEISHPPSPKRRSDEDDSEDARTPVHVERLP